MYRDKFLEGKAALIFGGSRGIGAAIAKRLAKAGANVALTYVSGADKAAGIVREIEGEGCRGVAIRADSAEAEDVFSAVDHAAHELEHLDIVVVNAGVLALGAIDGFTLEDLDRSIAVNLRGVFLAVQAAQRRMAAGGRIITIGSNAASLTAPGASVYSMTKAAVAAMVKGIAIDLAPREITVNNIQPGPTLTDMTANLIDHVLPMIPLKRVAAPDEIAELALYLAGEASGYMTGASLTIDGGMSL